MVAFNVFVLFANVATASFIFWALLFEQRVVNFPVSHRIGLWVAGLGLFGQALRNAIFLTTGDSPSDNDLPLWVLKDAGYWVIAFALICAEIRQPNR